MEFFPLIKGVNIEATTRQYCSSSQSTLDLKEVSLSCQAVCHGVDILKCLEAVSTAFLKSTVTECVKVLRNAPAL